MSLEVAVAASSVIGALISSVPFVKKLISAFVTKKASISLRVNGAEMKMGNLEPKELKNLIQVLRALDEENSQDSKEPPAENL